MTYRSSIRRATRCIYATLGRRPGVGKWLVQQRRQECLVLECVGALLAVCVGMALLDTGVPRDQEAWLGFAFMLLDPLRAVVATMLTCVALPDLLGRRALNGSAPVALSMVFVAWLVGLKKIGEGPFGAVAVLGETPIRDDQWLSWPFLATTLLLQIAALCLLRSVRRFGRR